MFEQITEDELRNHFTPDLASEITDCKLKYDVNGNFRGFAFIGFKGNDTASKVINNYNKSYITTARIIVENYDENAPSIKTRFMKNEQTKEESSGDFKEAKSKTEKLNPFKDLESDPKFQEFLKVQRNIDSKTSKSKGYIWSDDVRNDEEMDPLKNDEEMDPLNGQIIQSSDEKQTVEGEKSRLDKKKEKKMRKREKGKEKKSEESNGETKKFEVKLSKLPCKVKKNEIRGFFSPIIPKKVVTLGSGKGIAYAGFESENDLKGALLKHKSFFNGKQVYVKQVDVTEKSNSSPDQPASHNCQKKKEYREPTESVADTSRLYIRNLSYSVQSEDIEDLFKGFGELTEVYVPVDAVTKKPKGFAFVSFLFPEHAIKALESLDKTVFQGRLLHIIPGASKPDTVKLFNQLSSFKQSKQVEAAKESEKGNNWNALFLGTNATAEVMAKKYDVSKSQLLADTTASDSVAVRMALGETQIVNETKAFLIQHGIDLDSFNHDQNDSETRKKRKRSKTTILVKNLPPKTRPEEIEEFFTRYGSVNRILLPPHGVTAIVEMQNVSEAKKAFQKMSVFKFKHVPLYLEWAPINIFKSDSDQNVRTDGTGTVDSNRTVDGNGTVDVSTKESKPGEIGESNIDPDGRTLFVKNVSFETSDESLKEHFSKCGLVKSAKVSRRKGSGKNGEPILLSMGFGFVVYQRAKDAEKGLRNLQNSLLDGHRLQVARSRSVGTSPVVARLVVFFLLLTSSLISLSHFLSILSHFSILPIFSYTKFP